VECAANAEAVAMLNISRTHPRT